MVTNLLQQIEEIEILQIICAGSGTISEARELNAKKMALVNQYYNEQLIRRVERLIQPTWFRRLINQSR